MDKDVYGIKLTMDVSDFEKGTKKVKEAIKDIEDKTNVVINTPTTKGFEFSKLGAKELEKQLSNTRQEFERMKKSMLKLEYYDPITKSFGKISPEGTQEQIEKYYESLEKIMSLEDEMQKRNPYIVDKAMLEEEQKRAEFLTMPLEDLRAKVVALLTKLITIKGIE